MNTPHNKDCQIQNNCDFDQLILEYYDPNDPAGGWIHCSYNEKGANRKQVLTYDGKKYEGGLPVPFVDAGPNIPQVVQCDVPVFQ